MSIKAFKAKSTFWSVSISETDLFKAVLGMFLCLPHPDPLVRGMDPDPDPSISQKGVEQTEILLAK